MVVHTAFRLALTQRPSPSMRLALEKAPTASPGEIQWRTIGQGFDVSELPVLVDGQEVDRILHGNHVSLREVFCGNRE